ncbi:MAG: DNA mismatch repair endonuclease MutL [Bacteroidales bacterium]
MSDIIQLLPDSVANQIAAGEVIQRPASVVKELTENSVDAGSTSIRIIVREAGKNLVQVIDNGSGMSETDARLSFERHATSKIRTADDLFAIKTMGFRGEALSSVAAIAEIEMQTRRREDETGTLVEIKGARFVRQEPVACRAGCTLSIKNLFFNVPARRKFLKKNSTELRHIINEFQRIALAHPEIEFSLQHGSTEILHLPPSHIRQRIMHVFGRNINQQLVEIKTRTSLVDITGFIAKPGYAKKSPGEQFFFTNKRFMRHPYFHKAVCQAYDKILPPDTLPSYFIYFDADPESVDVNIHPTKTEIKFENEQAIWQILMASIREALGKFNLVPSIDFNTDGMMEIPVKRHDKDPVPPEITVNPGYNPFEQESGSAAYKAGLGAGKSRYGNWEELYKNFESDKSPGNEQQAEKAVPGQDRTDEEFTTGSTPALLQLKNRYILSPVKSGFMIIDQKRAHERILYEKFMKTIRSGSIVAQQQLYPVNIEFSPSDYLLIKELSARLADFGFDIRDFGPRSILISGCPADMGHADPSSIIENLLSEYKTAGSEFKESPREKIARNLARSSAINYGKHLSREEMHEIIDRLFACEMPNYSPDGKTVIVIINNNEIDNKFRES